MRQSLNYTQTVTSQLKFGMTVGFLESLMSELHDISIQLIRPHRRVTSWEQTALLSLRKLRRILQYCQTVTSQTHNHSFSDISTHDQFSLDLGPWQESNWANTCLTRRQILQITFKRNTT